MPEPAPAVRKATVSDLPGIVRCLRAAFEPYREAYTPGAFRDTVPSLSSARERLRSMAVWVAETPPGTVLGTIAVGRSSEKESHLRGMAVVPERQGTLLASALLRRAIEESRRMGCRRVTLDTTTPLRRAIRFYEKHGFRRSGRVTDFFGMPLYEYLLDLEPDRTA
jgi:GNAT superfamily N-acetyltransferase